MATALVYLDGHIERLEHNYDHHPIFGDKKNIYPKDYLSLVPENEYSRILNLVKEVILKRKPIRTYYEIKLNGRILRRKVKMMPYRDSQESVFVYVE